MGIKEPSFFESYGESFFAQGNPDLDPERSTTFDVGRRAAALREPAARVAHVLPQRLQGPDRLQRGRLQHLPGHLREPRPHPGAGARARARGAARAAALAPRPVHAAWTARSSRARATSIPSTRSGSRCCAGRGTRARSARSSRSRAGAPGSRWRSSASGRTATSSAWGSRQPRLRAARRPPARAPGGTARGVRGRRQPAGRGRTRRRWAIPRSAAPCAAGCGCASAAAGARDDDRERAAPRPARGGARLRRSLLVALDRWRSRGPAAEAPQRVASINLSADEVLVAILPKERLVSVTQWADAPGTSNVVGRVPPGVHRFVKADMEQLVALRPDLVVVSEYTDADFMKQLERSGPARPPHAGPRIARGRARRDPGPRPRRRRRRGRARASSPSTTRTLAELGRRLAGAKQAARPLLVRAT